MITTKAFFQGTSLQGMHELAILLAIIAFAIVYLVVKVYRMPGGGRDLRRSRKRICEVLAASSEDTLDLATIQRRSGLGGVAVINGACDLVTCGIVRMHTEHAPSGAILSRRYGLVKREREARLARGRALLRANAE